MKLKRVTTLIIDLNSFIFRCLSVYNSEYDDDCGSDYVSKSGDGVYIGRSHRQTPVGVVPV
jgi:hypothetical protein